MTRGALCVGINEFKNLPTNNWLNGCVNDAEDVAAILTGPLHFADGEVTTMTDSQATKSAVLGGLTDLVGRATRGEVNRLVFSLSSHGTQVPDVDGDESDGADEAFVMFDVAERGDEWDRSTVILDDELHRLFSMVPSDVLVEVLLDTCHSGTGLRSLDLLPGRRPRFLPPPTAEGVQRVEDANPRSLRELVKGGHSSSAPVLFAACRSSQTASDAHFDGRFNGAFTYYLLKALTLDAGQPRSRVLGSVTTALRQGRFSQRPQLEAPPAAKTAGFGFTW